MSTLGDFQRSPLGGFVQSSTGARNLLKMPPSSCGFVQWAEMLYDDDDVIADLIQHPISEDWLGPCIFLALTISFSDGSFVNLRMFPVRSSLAFNQWQVTGWQTMRFPKFGGLLQVAVVGTQIDNAFPPTFVPSIQVIWNGRNVCPPNNVTISDFTRLYTTTALVEGVFSASLSIRNDPCCTIPNCCQPYAPQPQIRPLTPTVYLTVADNTNGHVVPLIQTHWNLYEGLDSTTGITFHWRCSANNGPVWALSASRGSDFWSSGDDSAGLNQWFCAGVIVPTSVLGYSLVYHQMCGNYGITRSGYGDQPIMATIADVPGTPYEPCFPTAMPDTLTATFKGLPSNPMGLSSFQMKIMKGYQLFFPSTGPYIAQTLAGYRFYTGLVKYPIPPFFDEGYATFSMIWGTFPDWQWQGEGFVSLGGAFVPGKGVTYVSPAISSVATSHFCGSVPDIVFAANALSGITVEVTF